MKNILLLICLGLSGCIYLSPSYRTDKTEYESQLASLNSTINQQARTLDEWESQSRKLENVSIDIRNFAFKKLLT